MRSFGLTQLAFVSLLAACSSTRDDNPFQASSAGTSSGGDGGPGGTTSGAVDDTTADGATTADSVDGSTSDGIKLDVGPGDVPGPQEEYCNFVDILFVIDNSLSMKDYQTALALSWPDFVDEMWANLPVGTDLHVGMTTTSFFSGSCSEGVINCVTTASQSTIEAHYTPPQDGSTGVNGEQGRLFEWDGKRYFEATVGGDSDAFKTWFSQAAVAAGETGCSFEVSSAGAAYPFHEANADYNQGFLRDEGAVLLIVVLTDEPDKSPEGAQTYYDMIIDAKSGCGGDDCVIITGLVDECIEGVDNALWQFFNLFGNFQTVGSIEEPTAYSDVVGAALAQVVAETCEQIPPAG